jgi:two-component sensor histidine kinase
MSYGWQHGEIRILLERLTVGTIKLTVEDDGVGWRGEGPIQGTGMGSRIIAAMARGLGWSVVYGFAAAGCQVQLEFPI